MPSAFDLLEERVAAAVDLIGRLRLQIRSLETALATAHAIPPPDQPVPPASLSSDPALGAEVERLRAERTVIRESIRGLLREIDRVAW